MFQNLEYGLLNIALKYCITTEYNTEMTLGASMCRLLALFCLNILYTNIATHFLKSAFTVCIVIQLQQALYCIICRVTFFFCQQINPNRCREIHLS